MALRSLRPGGLAAAALVVVQGCAGPPPPARPVGPPTPGPAPLDDDAREWVRETLESLTLREKVAQLVIEWIPGAYASTTGDAFESIERWVVEDGIGGLSISIGLPHSYAAKLNELQRRAEVPLLVTSDFENGGPGMRIRGSYALPSLLPQGGGTDFPPTMAFGAIGEERFAYEYGRITGVEARALGVHLNFAPVLDVNSNPENPIINTRSFGEDPEAVARLGTAFIRGARDAGVMSTVKHFPGHGDTRTDSHIELPVVPADRTRLDTLELVPFRAAIDDGVDAVMTAHVAVPEILGEESPPATLSPYFLTDLLREELGFRGLVLTDAMSMGAIRNEYGVGAAAVRAVAAGADVILSPKRVTAAIDEVVAAVESGRLPEARVTRSARRILETKARAGLHEGRLVSLEAVDDRVGTGAHAAFADTAAVRSLTLPRDRRRLVPLDPAEVRSVYSLTFGREANLVAGRTFDARLSGAVERLERGRADYGTRPLWYDSIAPTAARADLVVVQAYVPPRAGSGTVGVPDGLSRLVRELVVAGRRVAVISFGNPYLLSAFPQVGTYLLAWGGREVSQGAAARALLGEVPVTGTLPISLPPFHRRGEGLVRHVPETIAEDGGGG